MTPKEKHLDELHGQSIQSRDNMLQHIRHDLIKEGFSDDAVDLCITCLRQHEDNLTAVLDALIAISQRYPTMDLKHLPEYWYFWHDAVQAHKTQKRTYAKMEEPSFLEKVAYACYEKGGYGQPPKHVRANIDGIPTDKRICNLALEMFPDNPLPRPPTTKALNRTMVIG